MIPAGIVLEIADSQDSLATQSPLINQFCSYEPWSRRPSQPAEIIMLLTVLTWQTLGAGDILLEYMPFRQP